MMAEPRNFYGFRIRGLKLFSWVWYPSGRRIGIASYHHPKRMCWLWFLDLTFRLGIWPSISRLPGHQSKTYVNLPFCTFLFCWQDEGRFSDPSDQRVRELIGVKDWTRP